MRGAAYSLVSSHPARRAVCTVPALSQRGQTMLRSIFITFLGVLFLLLRGTSSADSSICGVCKCSAENKTIDCVGRGLSDHFPNESLWKAVGFAPQRLDLKNNIIVHVHPFPGLPNLEILDLRNNRISRFDNKSFRNLTALKVLDLSHNEITTDFLQPNVFEGPYQPEEYTPLKVTNLDLGYNALHALHQDVFEHLPHLEVLSLRGNPLRVIDRGTLMALTDLPHLRVLDLSSTQLRALPEYILHRPLYLENLDLSYNLFNAPPKELSDNHGLKRLDLSGNNFTTLTSFPDLLNLTTLVIDHCENLTYIGKGALSNLRSLNQLSISGNQRLSSIHEEALSQSDSDGRKFWPPITKLSLDDNALSELPAHLLDRWDVLEELNLDKNPWACDCTNQWILTVLIPMMDKKTPLFGYTLQCASPPELAHQPLRSMSRFHHLRCPDLYGNRPERDAAMLIGVLIGALVAVPITAALVMLWRRGVPLMARRTKEADQPCAYYRVNAEYDM